MTVTGLYFIPHPPTSSSSTTTTGATTSVLPAPSLSSTPSGTKSPQPALPLLAILADTLLKHPPSGTVPTRLPSWGLSHNLSRSTPSAAGTGGSAAGSGAGAAASGQETRNMQYLHLSYRPGVSYVAISTPPPLTAGGGGQAPTTTPTPTPTGPSGAAGDKDAKPDVMIALPHPHGAEDFVSLVQSKMGPLWQHRQTLEVGQGIAYLLPPAAASRESGRAASGGVASESVEDGGNGIGNQGVIIRMGEVKSKTGPRGVVIAVELLQPRRTDETAENQLDGENKDHEQEPEDWDRGEEQIRAVWNALGLKDGRAFIRVAGVGQKRKKGGKGMGLDLARQYCEMLRMRG